MSDPRRKILFLPGWFPNKKHPENGDFILRHAQAASQAADITIVFITSDSEEKNLYRVEKEAGKSLVIYRAYYRKPAFSILQFITYTRVYFSIIRQIFKLHGRPDLVHVHIIYPAGIIAVFLKWIYGLKFVITEHWTGHLPSNFKYNSRFRVVISRFIANRAELILPVSMDLRKALERQGLGKKFDLVFNVVDCSLFKINRDKIFNGNLIHISSLKDDHKNISGILRVIARLAETGPAFRLTVIGNGDAEPHIRLAQELNILNTYVFFMPAMPHEKIAAQLASQDAFVLFSNSENLPCVMIEAMACGLPVISSRVGGIPEHITKENGILVEAGNENQLYGALRKYLNRECHFDAENIRRYAVHYFSMAAVSERFNQVYQSVAGK